MKQITLSVLLFLVFSLAYGMEPEVSNTQIDSSLYYHNLANNPKNHSNLIKSYIYYNKTLNHHIKLNDTLSVIKYLRQLSIIQYSLGDYFGSETNAVKALSLLENVHDAKFSSESKVGIYNQLGRIYFALMNFDEAIKQYENALTHTHNQNHINIIRNNIGLIFLEQLNHHKAEREFLDVYQHSLPLDDEKQIARALDNLGFSQFKLNNPEGLSNMIKALRIRQNIKDEKGLYSSFKNLSTYYKENNNTEQATIYARKAYTIAKALNSTSFLEDALTNWITLNPNPKVLEYHKLKDSLDKAKQLAENKYALIKFNYHKQEQIANDNRIKQEQERADKIMYQGIGVLILISSIFTFVIIKTKHKKDKIEIVYNTESRISKKVHDELANDIFQIMTKLQNNAHIQDEMLDDLEAIYSKTRDISKENSPINIKHKYQEQLKDLFISYNTKTVNVITKGLNNIEWDTFNDIKKITLYRVLQELLVNMKKHSNCTNVVLSFTNTNNKTSITYADNGNGCSVNKGSGLWNMENRIKSINGTIIFESEPNKGFKAKITV